VSIKFLSFFFELMNLESSLVSGKRGWLFCHLLPVQFVAFVSLTEGGGF
jgi:hypothetical protein